MPAADADAFESVRGALNQLSPREREVIVLHYLEQTPVEAKGQTTLEVFDPEYFVAFTFLENAPISLEGAPAGCSASYRPPQQLDARTMAMLATIPADQPVLPPALRSAANALANLITLTCK